MPEEFHEEAQGEYQSEEGEAEEVDIGADRVMYEEEREFNVAKEIESRNEDVNADEDCLKDTEEGEIKQTINSSINSSINSNNKLESEKNWSMHHTSEGNHYFNNHL